MTFLEEGGKSSSRVFTHEVNTGHDYDFRPTGRRATFVPIEMGSGCAQAQKEVSTQLRLSTSTVHTTLVVDVYGHDAGIV